MLKLSQTKLFPPLQSSKSLYHKDVQLIDSSKKLSPLEHDVLSFKAETYTPKIALKEVMQRGIALAYTLKAASKADLALQNARAIMLDVENFEMDFSIKLQKLGKSALQEDEKAVYMAKLILKTLEAIQTKEENEMIKGLTAPSEGYFEETKSVCRKIITHFSDPNNAENN